MHESLIRTISTIAISMQPWEHTQTMETSIWARKTPVSCQIWDVRRVLYQDLPMVTEEWIKETHCHDHDLSVREVEHTKRTLLVTLQLQKTQRSILTKRNDWLNAIQETR